MSAFGGKFLLGVNYWSRAGGPRMWERFDEATVKAELAQMRAIGLDCCRMFAFVPSLMPAPPAVDAGAIGHLRQFAALSREAGVGILPTALVGHMSGENFDFPGGGRALFTDEKLLQWQAALVARVVEAAKGGDVQGWVLSNEMPLWADPATPVEVASWCARLREVVRARDPRPVGVGDGNMGGWPTREVAPHVDWLAPHVYYADADPMRQALQTDLSLRQLQPLGLPLLLEEFGCSSAQAGEAEQASYYREAIVAALGVGARGALGWCWSDFDTETLGREPPYVHHAFELGFGLTRKDGSEKPVCDELRALRRLLDGLDLSRVERPASGAALVVPAYLDGGIPFSWEDKTLGRRTLLQAYVLACQAGLDPAVVGEDDDLSAYRLLLCPSTQKLKTTTWQRLRAAARAGATVYWSYFSGDYNFHQAMWCDDFPSLTGLRHRLRYGCFDLPGPLCDLRGEVALQVPTSIERLADPYPLARLPVELLPDAPVRVLSRDRDGRVALTSHAIGEGEVVFLAWPLERYLALLADGSARDAHRLYRWLGESAGVGPRYPTRHPDVHSRVLELGNDDIVIVQHRGWATSVDDATEVPNEAELLFDRGSRGAPFGEKAVRIYRVRNVR
jgi:endo-1,4-beta-mannosidase